jgi:hypothetical protein
MLTLHKPIVASSWLVLYLERSSAKFRRQLSMLLRRALVDFLGVAIGASGDAPVRPVRSMAQSWNAAGNARIFLGRQTAPAVAALVNGTMAHAMDYDDTHPMGAGHPSAPCWSTALALGEHHGLDEKDMLAAFITGYEVMAKLGGGGVPGVGRKSPATRPASDFRVRACRSLSRRLCFVTAQRYADSLCPRDRGHDCWRSGVIFWHSWQAVPRG